MDTIKDWPLMERPREKLLHLGPAALSNAELVAILIGSGTQKIPLMTICGLLIEAIDDQPGRLAKMTIGELCEVRGIGQIKAIVIAAAIELGKRAAQQTDQPLKLETIDQVAAFLSPYLPGQESAGYYLVMCNNRKELLATQEIAISNDRPPSVKLIIKAALAAGAAEILLCRTTFELSNQYLNEESAFIIQLEAAACMMNMGMRGLVIMENEGDHDKGR